MLPLFTRLRARMWPVRPSDLPPEVAHAGLELPMAARDFFLARKKNLHLGFF